MSDEPPIPDVQCYVRHIRAASLCTGGAREWFRRRGWNWGQFLIEGRPASDFIATKDPLALRMVEAARKEAGFGQGE